MKAYPDCIPCTMRQALEACQVATNDKSKQGEVMERVARSLSSDCFDKTPLELSCIAQEIVREVTGVSDPYKKLKKKSNEKAMELYPDLKQMVSESENHLLTATKLTVAGNVIDIGPGHRFEVKKTIEEVMGKEFAINHFEEFRKALGESELIYYIGDNAGEIVFDKVLLEELDNKEIVFFVRDKPNLNDITREDAEFVDMGEISEIREMKSKNQGSGTENKSQGLISDLQKADIVISKGQGNYEAFNETEVNIFFVLMVKCSVVGKEVGSDVDDIILKRPT